MKVKKTNLQHYLELKEMDEKKMRTKKKYAKNKFTQHF